MMDTIRIILEVMFFDNEYDMLDALFIIAITLPLFVLILGMVFKVIWKSGLENATRKFLRKCIKGYKRIKNATM